MAIILEPTKSNFCLAAKHLQLGNLVAFPTETIYGLGADATNEEAIAKIYRSKGRPSKNPLIVHYQSILAAKEDAILNDHAILLAEKLLPGPLTLILPKRNNCRIGDVATSGLKTIAIRVPESIIALELLKEFGGPIVAPSANPSGRISPSSAIHVANMMGDKIDYIIDGGRCKFGIESTILDLSGQKPRILRQGSITQQQLEIILNQEVEDVTNFSDEQPIAPGMMYRHYAPKCDIRIGCANPQPNEALIAFGEDIPAGFKYVINLSVSANLQEAAANLFDTLFELESKNISSIATMIIPDVGLGKAINDRLSRAAQKHKTN